MATNDEQRMLEQEFHRGLGRDGTQTPEVRVIAEVLAGGTATPEDIQSLGVQVTDFQRAGRQWIFELRARAVLDGKPIDGQFEGDCRFEDPKLVPGTIAVRPKKVASRPPETGPAWPALRSWAVAIGLLLPLLTAAGFAGIVVALRWALDGETTDLPQLFALSAATGWLGSCGAALRSFVDRYRNGFEYDDERGRRAQWPPRAAGTERFSQLMAPTFLLRPLLGATIAPIAYFTLRLGAAGIFAQGMEESVERTQLIGVLAISGLVGMFAKSIWDNLNERTQNLFKP